jgi:Tol biopolymer transport system component
MRKLLQLSFVTLMLGCLVTACGTSDEADTTAALKATMEALETRVAREEVQPTSTPLAGQADTQAEAVQAQPAPTGGAQVQPTSSGVGEVQAQPTPPPGEETGTRDSQLIAFTSLRDSTPYQVNQEIYLMKPDGSQQVNLTRHWAWDDAPAWSPDGKKIAFWSDRDGNPEIYVMDADGKNIRRLTNDPADDINPSWSPDGTRIAFVSERRNRREIFLMSADGSGQAPLALADNPKRYYDRFDYPAWSPDGSRIAFLARYQGQPIGEICLVSPDGGSEVAVKGASAVGRPAWSPDGKQISFPAWDLWKPDDPTPEIYVVNLDGSQPTRLAAPAMDAFPSWSPDGKAIVFESDRAAELDYHHDLYLLNIQGALEQADPSGLARLTTDEGRSPAWSPAGVTVDLAGLANAPAVEPVPPLVSTVCASGCDFAGIQAAVEAAQPGATIEVRSGGYTGPLVLNKPLTLRGEDSGGGAPVIRAPGDSRAVVELSADRVVLEGFHLVEPGNPKLSDQVMVRVKSNHNAIVGNTFEACPKGHCIRLENADCNSIQQNTFGQASQARKAPAVSPSPGGQAVSGGAAAPPRPASQVGSGGAAAPPRPAGQAGSGGSAVAPRPAASPAPPGPVAAPVVTAALDIHLSDASYNQITENSGPLLATLVYGGVANETVDEVTLFNSAHHNLVTGNASRTFLDKLAYENIIANNQGAISLNCGPYLNTVARNQISQESVGIQLTEPGNLNLIALNNIDGSHSGIYSWRTNQNLFYANRISNSASYGIVLSGRFPGTNVEGADSNDLDRPYLNVLHRNILVDNKVSAYDGYLPDYWEKTSSGMGEKFRNRWYSGGVGNYHSNYDEPAEGCQNANGDLFCDTGYAIPGGKAVDPYPFVQKPDNP